MRTESSPTESMNLKEAVSGPPGVWCWSQKIADESFGRMVVDVR